jgi:aerobic-type carbon monoxide dehydrogenase small subunit (CoxS/CutS family)
MTNANNNAHSRPRNIHLTLNVNGEEISVSVAPYKTLLEVLREDLLLTGTKHGCELGECGACTVLVDGQPLMSCLVLALECEDRKIETVEGMASKGKLHPLQLAFAEHGGSQCGYCTGGMLMSARALLESQPRPDRQQIREALSGNLCRCTGYQQIIDSVEAAAATMRDGGTPSLGDKP